VKEQVTRLLMDWHAGDPASRDALWPLMYDELRRLAQHHMNDQKPGHTLQATALVNEAFLKLGNAEIQRADKGAFFGLAASAMRSILVDHARSRGRAKRGGGAIQVTLADDLVAPGDNLDTLMALDKALRDLAARDQRKADIAEMRLFGGLAWDEIAAAMDLSSATVRSEMRFARSWLESRISDPGADG
jgi:RNA polymerase sigma factor (TIGR02999 family)